MNISKRRHYLVNKNMQFRYMAFVAVPLILLLSGLYYLIYYSVFTQMMIPEAVVTTLLPAMKHVNTVVAIFVPVALFVILRAALIYSNRIIGPVPRLERELDKIIAGDYSARIRTRDNDELRHFVEKINMLVEKIDATRA